MVINKDDDSAFQAQLQMVHSMALIVPADYFLMGFSYSGGNMQDTNGVTGIRSYQCDLKPFCKCAI